MESWEQWSQDPVDSMTKNAYLAKYSSQGEKFFFDLKDTEKTITYRLDWAVHFKWQHAVK